MWRRIVDCLGVAVSVESRVAELDSGLEALLRSYRDAPGPPEVAFVLEVEAWPTLRRDGEVVARHDEAIDLVAAVEQDLYRAVIARAGGLLLHAAAVAGAGGRALVFAGRSGAGKSTLLRGLMARGLRYVTEEVVSLEPGRCRGLARALHVDDPAVALPPGWSADEYLVRAGGAPRRTRIFHVPEAAIWRGPARAVAVVAIDHGEGAGDTLEALGGGDALADLWPQVFRPDAAALAGAGAALDGVARYRMRTERPEQALAHALALAAELDVTAP